jgi:hypothetical protein
VVVEASVMSDPHINRIWRQMAFGVGGALLLAAVPLVAFGPGQPEMSASVRLLGWSLSIVAAVAWAFAFAIRVFNRADEYLRDRDKTAWLWGGVAGVAVSAPVYGFAMLGGLGWLESPRDFALGYGLLLSSELAGYLVFGAWLRWRRP